MNTIVHTADDAGVAEAARLLRAGEVVAIPTETVYGLAANALDGQAVKKIFAAKGRPQDNPLISHVASMEMLADVWAEVTPQALALARAFWPGPLTIILPRAARVADEVCAGLPTASVRWPSHPAQKPGGHGGPVRAHPHLQFPPGPCDGPPHRPDAV